MTQPDKVFRVSYKCPRCDELHQLEGPLPALMQFAYEGLRDSHTMQVLMQDSVFAREGELDLAEEAHHNPSIGERLMAGFKKMRTRR